MVPLITQPHPDFALEYTPELLERLYHLTAGQPYLIQRLCWELVNQWNERFLREGEATPRQLELADLETVITSDFYEGASYYFDGVWSNVTESERVAMRLLARDPSCTWTVSLLAEAMGQPTLEVVEAILSKLRDHDVIPQDEEALRFASGLMCRWVADHHLDI